MKLRFNGMEVEFNLRFKFFFATEGNHTVHKQNAHQNWQLPENCPTA